MKYGRLVFGYNSKQLHYNQHANVGDIFQTFAIDEIYRCMNIPASDIVDIGRQKLCSYDGDNVILPFHGWFGLIKGWDIIPLSPKIHPIFWGYHCIDRRNYKKMSIYRNNQPVVCRDEKTYHMMQIRNIESYLAGCFTMIFEKRTKLPDKCKVFMVDSPAIIDKHIPSHLRNCVEYISHEIPVFNNKDYYAECKRIELIGSNILNRYKNEASLVVTSRLHCAVPCMAMGIPVILVRDSFDERFSWLEKWLPLYTTRAANKINWNPSPIDLEDIKLKLKKIAISMLSMNPDRVLLNDVHKMYMDRERSPIHTSMKVYCYHWLHGYFPMTTDFIREILLKNFTLVSHIQTISKSNRN